MKRVIKNFISAGIICLFALPGYTQDIVLPVDCTIIEGEDIGNIGIVLNIQDFDPNRHYWVAIASAKNFKSNWQQLIQCLDQNCPTERLKSFMENWEPDLFWPKKEVESQITNFVISTSPPADGDYHPWMVLLIEATAQQHQIFTDWMKGPKYPGIPGALIKNNIKEQCNVLFRR